MKLLNDFNGDGMFVNDMIKFSMYYDGSPSSIRKVGTCDERLRKYHIDSKMRLVNCRSLHMTEKKWTTITYNTPKNSKNYGFILITKSNENRDYIVEGEFSSFIFQSNILNTYPIFTI